MYSPNVIDRNQNSLEKRLGLKLHRYSPADSLTVAESLQKLIKKGKLTRGLTPAERQFVQNEQLLCTLDFRYSTRYFCIELDGAVGVGIGPATLWESQELTLEKIGKIEEENYDLRAAGEPCTGICICNHKSRQLGNCLGKGTRILTKDLRWVPIETLNIGDEIIGTDEDTSPHRGVGRKMRTSRITGTYMSRVPTVKLTLEDGTEIVTTPHHKFLVRRYRRWQWIEVNRLRKGNWVRRIAQVWDEKDATYEDGWFGGMLDGEGSVGAKSRSGADACVSQVEGPVLDRARRYLDDNEYKWRVEIDRRKAGDTSKLGSKPVHKYCVSGMAQVFRLLGTTRPSRFIGFDWWDGKELPMREVYAKVVKVEDNGVQDVYDLQTTTHTYAVEGFICHNTMLNRLLAAHRLHFWKHSRAMAASLDDSKVHEQLYKRDKLIYDNLPWFLKSAIKFDVKDGHFELLNGSYVMYQKSSQESGLGQGSQFDVSHITEVASWPNPRVIELDFIPTIPQSPYALCGLESTSQGRGDWWHEFTEKVRMSKVWRWHYVFWPWYVNSSKYKAKAPDEWRPAKFTTNHAKMVAETSHKFVGKTVELTRSQLYWYEMSFMNAREKGELNLFLLNYAATPEESFQHAGASGFDTELLNEIRTLAETAPHGSYEFIPAGVQ